MVALGGAGPLHACAVADDLGITRILVPQHPGLFCALGLLEADLHTDDILAVLQSTGTIDHAALQRWFEESEERARVSLIEQGVQPQTVAFRRQYDARYRGQSFELTIDHGDWWYNLRPSNTEPLLRLNVEAKTPELCAAHVADVQELIATYADAT